MNRGYGKRSRSLEGLKDAAELGAVEGAAVLGLIAHIEELAKSMAVSAAERAKQDAQIALTGHNINMKLWRNTGDIYFLKQAATFWRMIEQYAGRLYP